MIGGFRRNAKRGNIRRKIATLGGSDEEDGQIETAAAAPSPVTTPVETAPAKIKGKKITSKTSLSFGDELEKEDEFVIKRSKASLTLEEQVRREKKRKKKKEKNLMENDPAKNSYPEVLEQTAIPITTNGIQNLEIKTFDEVTPLDSTIDEDSASHRFSFTKKLSNPGDIPDAATIYAMKKKREQARQFSGQVNYIPLDSNKHEGRFASGNSRLVREELNDSSDDDRVEMKGSCNNSHPALERRKQVAKALEEVEEDDEEAEQNDDDFQRWEDEQIKKGSAIPTNQPEPYAPKLPESNVVNNVIIEPNASYSGTLGISASTYDYKSVLSTNFPFQMYASNYSIPPAEQQEITVDLVERRLCEQLETKKQLHRLHQQQCDKTKLDLDSSKENISNLERKALDVSDRFTFFQEIRGFIKDLLECLREKVKKINELEDSMHQLLKKKSEKLISRRQNDVKDEVEQIGGKPNSDSDRINSLKNRRIAEREGRRARRRENRIHSAEKHNEGMSSDDEIITSDQLRFDADKGKLRKESESIFEDVVEDFQSLREIVSRFEQWKFAFTDSYKEAFLSLCLPKLFTPFIKLELLDWNPLEIDGNDFEDLDWYMSIALYGHHEGKLDENDEDLNLLPNIIERLLIPKLNVIMQDIWDPLSSKQTKHVTFYFQKLVDDYPTITKESKNTQMLVDTIVTRLRNAVESEIYIPLYSRDILEGKNSLALCFLERQFWKGVKLLQNVMEWNWLLSKKKLLQLGIDAILNRYLIIALQQFPDPVSSLEKAKLVVNILPKEWFEKSDNIVAGMQSFARCLHGLADSIYKSCLGYTDIVEQKKMKITIKKIISLLMHIQAFDEARSVANEYNFRKEKESPAASPGYLVT